MDRQAFDYFIEVCTGKREVNNQDFDFYNKKAAEILDASKMDRLLTYNVKSGSLVHLNFCLREDIGQEDVKCIDKTLYEFTSTKNFVRFPRVIKEMFDAATLSCILHNTQYQFVMLENSGQPIHLGLLAGFGP